MKKVLVTSRSFGQVSDEPQQLLVAANFEIEYYNDFYEESIFCEKLKDCDALIIGSHALTEKAVSGSPKLRIVSKHGAGLDNIDLEMTKRHGITVCRVPAVNANAVADLTFSLILDVARKVSYASNLVKQKEWKHVVGVDVFGKKLAIIGFGAIGQNVARRANGFSMEVYVYDPFIEKLPKEFEDAHLVSFSRALENADFLTIHVPLSKQTENLIGKEEISKMKKGSFIINTSRGSIVNEKALKDALDSGHIAGAGLDVLTREPLASDEPLQNCDHVVITPHMGMYSFEAINAVSLAAAKNITEYFDAEMHDKP